MLFTAILAAASGGGQETRQSSAARGTLTTVHGLVRNGASGEPLPRVLVRINGDAATAVMTDGEGRFEIPDVPEGPQDFNVTKPGFVDDSAAYADSIDWNARGYSHNVIIAPEMGDVVFTMYPVNSIEGQVQLSSGDMAQGIQVTLLKRTVQDGRAVWQSVTNAKTNSEGVYRFGGLSDGQYAVYTEPTMGSEAATNLVENGSGNNVPREGYASVFYPDAHDLAGAGKIHVAGGEQAQANITLTLEPFQSVAATVIMPSKRYGDQLSAQVTDAQGHALPYGAQYDASTHTVQATLPDGTFSFKANLMFTGRLEGIEANTGRLELLAMAPSPISGEVSFAVAGRAISNLRIPMATVDNSPVQVTVEHSPASTAQGGDPLHAVSVTLTQAGGWSSDGMVTSFAEGNVSRLVQSFHPPAGSYWAHTNVQPKTLCEASFTVGGVSLAHEPLVISESGSAGGPLILALRDDCAKLTLSLPGSVGLTTGVERSYTVYVVPDFESTQDVIPQTLRESTGGKITVTGLTPGNYHVYTFDRPVALEYRNPTVLAGLSGQAVTLQPNAEADLTVEVSQQ